MFLWSKQYWKRSKSCDYHIVAMLYRHKTLDYTLGFNFDDPCWFNTFLGLMEENICITFLYWYVMHSISNTICISICTVNGRYSSYVLYWNTTRSNQWKCYYTCLLSCSTKNYNTSCNTTDGLINAHFHNWSASSYYWYFVG